MAKQLIRDGIYTSERLAGCSLETHLAFAFLLPIADQWGRFELDYRAIWVRVGAYRDDINPEKVTTWLRELEEKHLFKRYTGPTGRLYGAWLNYEGIAVSQRTPSKLPKPPFDNSKRIEELEPSLGRPYPEPRETLARKRSRRREGVGDEDHAADAAQATDPGAISERYLACFNAVYGRKVGLTPKIQARVAARLKDGYRPWQVIAVPIMVDAQGLPADMRRDLNAEVPLRDGKHIRTSASGKTYGATDWLERALGKLDQTVLDERLAEIASRFEVLDQLMQCNVSVRKASGF